MIDAEELVAFWRKADGLYTHPDDDAATLAAYPDIKTDLHPVPWVGCLKSANVFLLYLNPGLDDLDHQYERDNINFIEELKINLEGNRSYLYLDDRFGTHPGRKWADRTFGADIQDFDYSKLCVLQLVAYHSKSGRSAHAVARKLTSSTMNRQFVTNNLLPRARGGGIGLIVARGASVWGLSDADKDENIVIYKGWQPRRALQTKNTAGGALLRRWLGKKER